MAAVRATLLLLGLLAVAAAAPAAPGTVAATSSPAATASAPSASASSPSGSYEICPNIYTDTDFKGGDIPPANGETASSSAVPCEWQRTGAILEGV